MSAGQRGMKPKSTPRIYYQILLIVVIVVNFTRIFVMQAFKIPSGSMVDNLLIPSKARRSLREVRRSPDYGSCSP